jgi:hypothetical protein
MTKRALSDHHEAAHHEAAQNIRRVQRQIALANLPHSYRLFDVMALRHASQDNDLPAANDSTVGGTGT